MGGCARCTLPGPPLPLPQADARVPLHRQPLLPAIDQVLACASNVMILPPTRDPLLRHHGLCSDLGRGMHVLAQAQDFWLQDPGKPRSAWLCSVVCLLSVVSVVVQGMHESCTSLRDRLSACHAAAIFWEELGAKHAQYIMSLYPFLDTAAY